MRQAACMQGGRRLRMPAAEPSMLHARRWCWRCCSRRRCPGPSPSLPETPHVRTRLAAWSEGLPGWQTCRPPCQAQTRSPAAPRGRCRPPRPAAPAACAARRRRRCRWRRRWRPLRPPRQPRFRWGSQRRSPETRPGPQFSRALPRCRRVVVVGRRSQVRNFRVIAGAPKTIFPGRPTDRPRVTNRPTPPRPPTRTRGVKAGGQ